jgi:hypothetical protein
MAPAITSPLALQSRSLLQPLCLCARSRRARRCSSSSLAIGKMRLHVAAHCVPLTCDRRERKVRMHSFARPRARGSRYSSPPPRRGREPPLSLTHRHVAPLSGLTAGRQRHCRAFAAFGRTARPGPCVARSGSRLLPEHQGLRRAVSSDGVASSHRAGGTYGPARTVTRMAVRLVVRLGLSLSYKGERLF